MRTARRARIGVVGLGRIGQLHADNLAKRVPGAELAAVVDTVKSLAGRTGRRLGVPSGASIDWLLGDSGIDGVVIATPTAHHAELVERAAAAGRQIFCEKPVGLTSRECASAVAAADAAGVALQVGFQRRFDRDWQGLREAFASGALGSLALFRCSHRNAAPPPGTGLGDLFSDLLTHDLDAARWLGGEIEDLHAEVTADGDGAVVSVRFAQGELGLIDVHRFAGYFECSAELVGTAGTVRSGYRASEGVELLREGSVTAELHRDHARRHAAAYVAELEHFADVATGRDEPGVTGADAVAALRLADQARRCAYAARRRGGARIAAGAP